MKSEHPAYEKPNVKPSAPPLEEREAFSKAMAKHFHDMKVGEKFKIPCGSMLHETRLLFEKIDEDNFRVFHYNTGEGMVEFNSQPCTVCEYSPVSIQILTDTGAWDSFASIKVQGKMEEMNALLSMMSTAPPKEVDVRLQKPPQLSASCPFHSAEAEFKHFFISQYTSLEKGWDEYKRCTSLVIKHAKETEAQSIDYRLDRMLFATEQVRHRYLDWLSCDPEQYNKTKNAYIQAICSIKPEKAEEIKRELSELIQGQSSLRALSLLDKQATKYFKELPYDRLQEVRKKYGEPHCVFRGINYLGLRNKMSVEYLRVLFRNTANSKSILNHSDSRLKKLSTEHFPHAHDKLIQEELDLDVLNIIKVQEVLPTYIVTEDEKISIQLIEDLMQNNLIGQNTLKTLKKVCERNNPPLQLLSGRLDSLLSKIDEKKRVEFQFNLQVNPRAESNEKIKLIILSEIIMMIKDPVRKAQMITDLVENGFIEIDTLDSLKEEYEKNNPSLQLLSNALDSLLSKVDAVDVEFQIQFHLQTAREEKNEKRKLIILAAVVMAVKDPIRKTQIANEIEDEKIREDIFRSVAMEYAQQGEMQNALDLIENALIKPETKKELLAEINKH